MILGCLTLPARILSVVILAGVLYLGWVNRAPLRRWVHRMTGESVVPAAPAEPPAVVEQRARAKLDSLAGGRADSIVLGAREIETIIALELDRRVSGLIDSLTVELASGAVAVRGQIDPSRLPDGALGPLAEWIKGRQTVEVSGPLNLVRAGTGEWRVEQVLVRGIPLPKGLRNRLLDLVIPGSSGSLVFPVDPWISGFRVTPAGAILYGRRVER